MKTLALTLTILISAHASAVCPVLTGDYVCKNRKGQATEINLANLPNHQFKLEDSVVRANEQGITEVSEGMGFRIETKGICHSDSLFVIMTTKNAESLSTIGQLVKSYRFTAKTQLKIDLFYEDDQQSQADSLSCIRK